MNQFNGLNLTIHGKVSNLVQIGTKKEFDEKKAIDCSNIDNICIDSSIAILNISASNTSIFEAHLYGSATIKGLLTFDVQVTGHTLTLDVKLNGRSFDCDLTLDVSIPKRVFKSLSIQSMSSDIVLSENITANSIKITTVSGNFSSTTQSNNIKVSTVSGDVNLTVNAARDLFVKISSVSGDVSTTLLKIKKLELSATSVSGKVKTHHIEDANGYVAKVDVSSVSGNILIT